MNITRRLIFVVSVLTLVISGCSQSPVPGVQNGASSLAPQSFGTSANDYGIDVAVNRDLGAIFVTGATNGSLDGPNLGGYDGFLRRYNRDGSLVWRVQFGSSNDNRPGGVVSDGAGNVYVTSSLRSASGYPFKATLKKFNKNGAHLWTRPFKVEYSENATARSVATDGAGNVYVAGDGFDRLYVRKYSSSGAVLWTRTMDPAGVQIMASSVVTDSSGNVYVGVGDYDDSWFYSFILKYSSGGTLLWKKEVGGDRHVNDLRVAGSALFVGGHKNYAYDHDTSTTPRDAFIAKYDLNGTVRWNKTFGTPVSDSGYGITADGGGNVYITGSTNGALAGSNVGEADGFVRKYNSAGSVVWTKQFGSAASDDPYDIAAYSGSELYLVGSTFGKLGAVYHGGGDAFLRRIGGTGSTLWTDQ